MLDTWDAEYSSNKQDFADFVLYCVERFRTGRGVIIFCGKKRVFFIPESVCGTDADTGIVISYEGGGVYVYTGERELNEYILVSAHFPLRIAKEVSRIINALITHYDRIRNDVLNPETERVDNPLLLTDETKGRKND